MKIGLLVAPLVLGDLLLIKPSVELLGVEDEKNQSAENEIAEHELVEVVDCFNEQVTEPAAALSIVHAEHELFKRLVVSSQPRT